ncbi:MAG TPA: glycoside hydrolase family 38 C-terminal domain-containing protein [Candidatus Limnocylindria bacterium]
MRVIAQRGEPRAASGETTAIVVSHTHWDREWYQSFERFRMRLVETIDLVLDILDERADFHAFMLDGQTVLLEDYLEVRPQHEARLAKHIASGRLLVGPFYVLADGFLPSPESLIRNLLIGREVASRYGDPMPVGYLPDQFGHPAQMPQLLAGFGITSATAYRGVPSDSAELWWEAPDGTRAFTVNLGVDGYCNANVLSSSPQLFWERMPRVLDRLCRATKTPFVLLMNGCDHMAPRPTLADSLDDIARDAPERFAFRQATLPEYVALARGSAENVPVVRGEFRRTGPAKILPGVISARMYLKLANHRVTTLLERGAEPLAALAFLHGAAYPDVYLSRAWRLLLQNAPHDSITGCSVDRVHRDMLTRYGSAQDLAEEVFHRGAEALAERLASGAPDGPASYVTLNVLPFARREYVRQRVQFLEPGVEFHLKDSNGRDVPVRVLARRPVVIDYSARRERFDREGQPYPLVLGAPKGVRDEIVRGKRWRRWAGEEVELLFAADLPATGYSSFDIVRGAGSAPATDLRSGDDWAENDLVRIDVHRDGTFDLRDKRTGVLYARLGAIESSGERGDEYTHCAPEEDDVRSSLGTVGTLTRVETGPIRASFEVRTSVRVPQRLAADRRRRDSEEVDLTIVTRIALSARRDRVEVTTTIDNRAEDHLVRAVFPTPIAADAVRAQGQFTIDERAVKPVAAAERALEPGDEADVHAFPHHALIDVSDGRHGLAVLDRGIAEGEAEATNAGTRVCLTLLRCVGWLSRPDLRTRPDEAGSTIETPEAQCPGTHVFEYAVVPHAGDLVADGVQRQAEAYVTPIHSASIPRALPEGERASFVAIEPAELAFSALKKAESTDVLVLRFWNLATHEVDARISFGWTPRAVWRADLGERARERLAVRDGVVRMRVRGAEIVTLLLVR